MSCRVVPGMADSTGRCRAVPMAAASNWGELMSLISCTNALHQYCAVFIDSYNIFLLAIPQDTVACHAPDKG